MDVVALYDELQSIRAVAERTGLPYSNVRRQLTRAGVELRPSGGARWTWSPIRSPSTSSACTGVT